MAFVQIYEPDAPREATDLEFHPTRDELWVVMREYPSDETCDAQTQSPAACDALEGSLVLIRGAGTSKPTAETLRDANGWHFLRRPPAIAMGAADTFATCGEARTGGYMDDPIDFIGPTLWSSDMSIFGPDGPGGNGSHLDMLHATPFCMGIAHERDNVYWTFNGKLGAIDKYDFAEPHVPGGDDHRDGAIWRYVEGELSRVPGVPSHMVYHAADEHLYVADTGNQRVVKLDTRTGSPAGDFEPEYDFIQTHLNMSGATLTEVVAPGVLTAPSGLALHDGLLYVTDSATSQIHAFELDGTPVRSVPTPLPAASLAGITVGPDGKLYLVEQPVGRVYRVDPG